MSENEERRSCENCGNAACASSVVAFLYDLCIESNYQKYWKPKKKKEEETE